MQPPARDSHPGVPKLTAFALGVLPEVERVELLAHLNTCPQCRDALGTLRRDGEPLAAPDVPPAPAAEAEAAPPTTRPDLTASYQPRPAAPADLAGHPRYEVLQLLGQGGMGAVYKARHKKMERLVALKVIKPRLLDNPKAVGRFHREVRAAARLEHPNIVRAYDADEAGATHFLVLEYVEGTDLARYVQKKGPLPVALACHFIRQAALGLQHAHQRGMVHRDIKPHNLMLTAQGVVKVMDFGLARLAHEGAAESGLTGENVLMGTADYIAPEQAQDARNADIRADIYSLGCSLFHLLAGKPPFADGNAVQKIAAHLSGTPSLADLPAGVPDKLRAVLGKMLEKDPANRYQTAAEVAQALAPFVKKGTGAGPPPLPPSPAQEGSSQPQGGSTLPRAKGRHVRTGIGAGLALILVLAASAVWLAGGWNTPPGKEGRNPEEDRTGVPPADFTNSIGMEFMLVRGGKAWLGGGDLKQGNREVEVPDDFYLGRYEVTQLEWYRVMGAWPSFFSKYGDGKHAVRNVPDAELARFPVESVSWEDAQVFLERLNNRDKQTGWVYRLPKGVEWEYACRGGPGWPKLDSAFDFYFETPVAQMQPEQANFAPEPGKGLQRTCKVGSYRPNRLGLYDMHGNVWEWCDDEATGADGATLRQYRGGNWLDGAELCRAALHRDFPPTLRLYHLGLRVARVPAGERTK